ncbi:MAG: hypothetical protein ACLPT6_11545 [Desulfobaccales bacterium]
MKRFLGHSPWQTDKTSHPWQQRGSEFFLSLPNFLCCSEAGFLVLFLQIHGVPEKIESHKGGLAPLPGDGNPGGLVEFQELPDISFVDLCRHPEIAPGIELFFLQKKTVVAMEIAG